MRRLLYLAALSLVAALVFAPAALGQGQTVTVSMEDNFFAPANVTVEPGTTVTWVQNGENPHTTTSYDGLWDSGLLPGGSGQTFSFTFNEPGVYEYFCIPHEDLGMVGSVTVTGGDAAANQDADQQPTDQQPAASADGAQDQPLPTTGGPALLLPAGVLLLATGLLGMRLTRRS